MTWKPEFCPGCGAATLYAVSIGTYCPSVLCDRGDDMREDVSAPAFVVVDHTKPGEPTETSVLEETVQLLREELIDMRKDNLRLRFMLNIDQGTETGCSTCPLSPK